MLNVSNDWKIAMGNYVNSNRPYLTPQAKVLLKYNILNEAAKDQLLLVEATQESVWSIYDKKLLVNEDIHETNFATLEQNQLVLDDSRLITDTPRLYEQCFVSTSCMEDGSFSENPTITIMFRDPLVDTLPGLTITWSRRLNEYARDYKVTAYAENNIEIGQWTHRNNKEVNSFTAMNLVGVKKIKIEIMRWCVGWHFARIEHFEFGAVLELTGKDLISFTHTMKMDLNSLTLPENRIQFEIDNIDSRFNPDNPQGLYGLLAERQKVELYYSVMIDGVEEQHLAGTFWSTKWECPQNGLTAKFEAGSAWDLMNNRHNYPSSGTYTYTQLAAQAFNAADLPVAYHIDSGYGSYSVNVSSLQNSGDLTSSAVVQLIANACNGSIYCDLNGEVYLGFKPIADVEVSDYTIDTFTSYQIPEYSLSKSLKNIVYNNSITIDVGEVGETQQISNPLIISQLMAEQNAVWLNNGLGQRKSVSGEYRCDPRLQCGDYIKNINKYAINEIFITELKYTYTGCFKGSYTGKVMKSVPMTNIYGDKYANEIYANEER